MRAPRFAVPLLVVLAQSTLAASAAAEGRESESEAATLFQEAKELMDQGRYVEACPKLDRSRRLDRQVGTTLNLAFCYERIGKTASSWSMWLDGAAQAAAKGQRERETLAKRAMKFSPDPAEDQLDLHMQEAREGSEGGYGTSGGGCGCN